MKRLLVASMLMMAASVASAFDYNDCVINGMKGLSSDVAARQIRDACREKRQDYERKQSEQLTKEYGKNLAVNFLVSEPFAAPEGKGFYSTQFKNTSDKTITFVRMQVFPAPGGAGTPCDGKGEVHPYRVSIKPGATFTFIYPSSWPSVCIEPVLILARAASWTDTLSWSSAKPTDKDPLERN